MMMHLGRRLTSNYAGELTLFHRLRDLGDGVSFFELTLNWDRYQADHNPKVRLHLVVLNYTVIEASVYYRHHRRLTDSDTIDSQLDDHELTEVARQRAGEPTISVTLDEL